MVEVEWELWEWFNLGVMGVSFGGFLDGFEKVLPRFNRFWREMSDFGGSCRILRELSDFNRIGVDFSSIVWN